MVPRWLSRLLPGVSMGLLVLSASALALAPAAQAAKPIPSTPRNASPPAYTTSIYETTTYYVTLYNQGCSAGSSGITGVVVLDYGEPDLHGTTYGTYDFGSNFDSDSAILHAAANFAQGFWNCSKGNSVDIAVGLSNYNGVGHYWTNSQWYTAGVQWAQMNNSVESFVVNNGYSSRVNVDGADDIEVEWASAAQSENFVDGFASAIATNHWLYDYGDDSGGTNPGHGWSAYDVWYCAYGASPSFPIPEIYYNVDATLDWEPLDLWAVSNEGYPMYIIGVMTEYPYGNTPDQGWTDMLDALNSNSSTYQSTIPWLTNI
jgi:hypothetical protein